MAELYVRFPKGRDKAVTLSYDDGVEQDIRLLEIMKKNGLKGTFNLNSGVYAPEGAVFEKGKVHRRMTERMAVSAFRDSGMEVAVHGLYHPYFTQIPVDALAYEVVKDRENLEKQFGTIVRGCAYPFGCTNETVVQVLRGAGIVYARTVESTHRFDLPDDWMRLPATCHHSDPQLMELARQFLDKKTGSSHLFYLWGHSYEFEADNNWRVIEEFAEYIGNRPDVWYATNIEIHDYLEAFKSLRFSYDRRIIENPTAMRIWFMQEEKLIEIKPGETIRL